MVTPEEAGERLATVHPLTDVLPPKHIEDSLLLALAGPIAENLHCYVRGCPETFRHCRVYIKQHPCGNERQDDYRVQVCST